MLAKLISLYFIGQDMHLIKYIVWKRFQINFTFVNFAKFFFGTYVIDNGNDNIFGPCNLTGQEQRWSKGGTKQICTLGSTLTRNE
jgi:hypothetical protein